MPLDYVNKFHETLSRIAPYMSNTVSGLNGQFGVPWEERFNETLQKLFGEDESLLLDAAKGYVRFALEVTKLQVKFTRSGKYIEKSYKEVTESVYHNPGYMDRVYLPGLLLSHFLWPHHYRLFQYFRDNFVPLILKKADKSFCDVGTGTGFYSRQTLAASPAITGTAFDISESSLNFAKRHVEAFGFGPRWKAETRDVITSPPGKDWPFLISVEVLEHLEDPVSFLRQLRLMLRQGGYGFITAAITAPNEDHIYLYNNIREVIDQFEATGFNVVQYTEFKAFEPKADEPVPRIGNFIVR